MRLGVNIDHIATLRNARNGYEPDLIQAALICEKVGVDGITVHLREDRRHIKDEDVIELKNILKIRLNLEMAATPEMQQKALENLPACCCIVPEKRQELTTEGGLDIIARENYFKEFLKPLNDNNIQVSMFIDADNNQVEAAKRIGAKYIELHTGAYAEAFGTVREEDEFQKLLKAAIYADTLGLGVNAGHGLNYYNVKRMLEIPVIDELNIGHSIISNSIFLGLENAVLKMKEMIS